MKPLLVLCCAALFATSLLFPSAADAKKIARLPHRSQLLDVHRIDSRDAVGGQKQHDFISRRQGDAELDLCGACIQVSLILINELLNIIANEGILGGCSTLCGKLPQKLEQEVCDAACVGLGIDEFIHILERADLDPIYYCELVRLCKIVDCQGRCLEIRSLSVKPAQVELGGMVVANVTFQVFNQTGTGMTRIDIYDKSQPKANPLQDDFLEVGYDPGMYEASIKIDTSQQTEFFSYRVGQYAVQVLFCEGECGSQHPHSKIYDTRNGTFTITA